MLLAIPDGAIALGAGTVLALGAAVVVLAPLLREDVVEPAPVPVPARPETPAAAVDALREIEFDRETGKLSDADYRELKASYTRQALAELRAKDAAAATAVAAPSDDVLESVIRGFRAGAGRAVCAVDGPRPEPDAQFCSACGRFLAGRCPHCGAAAGHDQQRFCESCGGALAAA